MTTDTLFEPAGPLVLPDLSAALSGLIERVKPGVVQVRSRRGGGAGVVWQSNGRIITNHHVVARASSVEVALPDGRRLDAKVVASEPQLDLALLDVAAHDLHAVPIGDSTSLRVGELVVAVGHPWGQRWVATAGIVSGLGTVAAPDNRVAPYIRSDVALAPGNSGGPMLNAQGAVVGINAMILGGDLAVAIPSQVVRDWIAGLAHIPVTLGVGVQTVNLPVAAQVDEWASQSSGLLVASLVANGLAAQSGVLVGDVLLDLAGTRTVDVAALQQVLAQLESKQMLVLHVLRGGGVKALHVDIGALERSA